MHGARRDQLDRHFKPNGCGRMGLLNLVGLLQWQLLRLHDAGIKSKCSRDVRGSNSDSDSDPYINTDGDVNSHADSDTNPDLDTYHNAYRDTDAHANGYGDAYNHRNSNGNANRDYSSDNDSHGNANSYGHTNSDDDSNNHSHSRDHAHAFDVHVRRRYLVEVQPRHVPQVHGGAMRIIGVPGPNTVIGT